MPTMCSQNSRTLGTAPNYLKKLIVGFPHHGTDMLRGPDLPVRQGAAVAAALGLDNKARGRFWVFAFRPRWISMTWASPRSSFRDKDATNRRPSAERMETLIVVNADIGRSYPAAHLIAPCVERGIAPCMERGRSWRMCAP